VIDSHVHIDPSITGLATALAVFDRAGIGRFAVKSGGPVGSVRYRLSLQMQRIMGDRMRTFINFPWRRLHQPGFIDEQVKLLAQAKADGVVGVKIFKALGLNLRDPQGKLVPPDAPILAPLFEACGRLGLILAWHVADPVAFFEPVTSANERYAELSIAESWSFYGKDYPSHDELIAARDRVIKRHPKTTFLLIHMANYPEDLSYVDKLLDEHSNVYVDTAARLPEFGRHPAKEVRAFFIKHQDRILFGSDFIASMRGGMQLGSVSEEKPEIPDGVRFYERHWRYFETEGAAIEHPTPIQGDWKVNPIKLPKEVLEKLYIKNAERLIFSQRAEPSATP